MKNYFALLLIVSGLVVFESSATEGDKYVSSCLQRVADGETIEVDRVNLAPCTESYVNERPAKYRLTKRDGSIHIATSIYFEWGGEDVERENSLALLDHSKSCIENFLARYGLIADLTFFKDTGWVDRDFRSDHVVRLHKRIRANAENWPLFAQGAYAIGEASRCGIHIHEFLHLLGLFDTYPVLDKYGEKICPLRRVENLDDIMNNSDTSDPKYLRLYPYAIKSILGPLCNSGEFL